MDGEPVSEEAARQILSTCLVEVSGLDASTLLQIAADLRLLEHFAEDETDTLVVDYIPAVAAQALIRQPGDAPGQPVLVEPVKITYYLESQMFGGETYVALTADGHVLTKPMIWISFEHLGNCILRTA